MNQTFIPDYSVRAISDVFYVAIKRNLYLAAKRATLMERSKKLGSNTGSIEPIDYEVEKVRIFFLYFFENFSVNPILLKGNEFLHLNSSMASK